MTPVEVQLKGLEKYVDKTTLDKVMRSCASAVLGAMHMRIHEQGKDTDGQQIGTYSKGYMVTRTGAYKNAKKKDAGFYTKGKKAVYSIKNQKAVKTKASKRKQYNRGTSTKVVVSLTRQMENDMKIIPLGKSKYGIGYTNKINRKKMDWVEETYDKDIAALTKQEKQLVGKTARETLKQLWQKKTT